MSKKVAVAVAGCSFGGKRLAEIKVV